jgi:hypothetical protein
MNATKTNRQAGVLAARQIVHSGWNDAASNSHQVPFRQGRVDPRLAFLARAGARLILVEEGLMTLEEAVDAAFIETAGLT